MKIHIFPGKYHQKYAKYCGSTSSSNLEGERLTLPSLCRRGVKGGPVGCEPVRVVRGIWEDSLPGMPCNYISPTQDASHHQDSFIFSRESQTKPLFVTLTGWGVDLRDAKWFLKGFNSPSLGVQLAPL